MTFIHIPPPTLIPPVAIHAAPAPGSHYHPTRPSRRRPLVVTIQRSTIGTVRVTVGHGQRLDVHYDQIGTRWTNEPQLTADCVGMGGTVVTSATGLDWTCRGVDH